MDLIDINGNPPVRRGGALVPNTNVMEGMRTIQGQAQAQLGASSAPRLGGPAPVPQVQVPWYTPEQAPRIAGSAANLPAHQAPLYIPESTPRIAGPIPNLPAQQAPWYSPEQAPRLAAPQSIGDIATQAAKAPAEASGPLSRAAGLAGRVLSRVAPLIEPVTEAYRVGKVAMDPNSTKSDVAEQAAIGTARTGSTAAGAWLGGTAGAALGGPAAPITGPIGAVVGGAAGYFGGDAAINKIRSLVGLDSAQPSDRVGAQQAARMQSSPANVPAIAQTSASAPAASAAPASMPLAKPAYDPNGRSAEMGRITNQLWRDDEMGRITSQAQQETAGNQPPVGGADGGGGQPPSGGNPILFATQGSDGTKMYHADGSTTSLQAGQSLPAEVQAFNQQSAQAGLNNQQPVQVIRGLTSTVAMPNPTAAQGVGHMQEVPMDVAQGGTDAVKKYQYAQAQNAINAANPLAAKTEAELAKVREENKGKLDVVQAQGQAGKVPPGYRMAADGQSMEKVPGGPADTGKALPGPAVKELSSAGASVEDNKRLVNTFKPEYGGHYILGDMSNKLGRLTGDTSGQTQWWQDMDLQQNQARHALFGSALTKGELDAWDKTSINPRMDQGEIVKNLTRRTEIEARAASKLARSYEAAGYNKEQIKELLGTASEYLDKPAPAVETQSNGAPKPAASTPSQAHIAALKANPDKWPEFEAKFGPGTSASILGK